jgi:hypothetical protein
MLRHTTSAAAKQRLDHRGGRGTHGVRVGAGSPAIAAPLFDSGYSGSGNLVTSSPLAHAGPDPRSAGKHTSRAREIRGVAACGQIVPALTGIIIYRLRPARARAISSTAGDGCESPCNRFGEVVVAPGRGSSPFG